MNFDFFWGDILKICNEAITIYMFNLTGMISESEKYIT